MSQLRSLMLHRAGLLLGADKSYLVVDRLTAAARAAAVPPAALLRAALDAPDTEQALRVVEAMTVGETSFFRDPPVFEALATSVLPDLDSRRGSSETLRIWSAGCATGQEAYSVAAVAAQVLSAGRRREVLATDLCRDRIGRARTAVYSAVEVSRGLSPEVRDQMLVPSGEGWVVHDALRGDVRPFVQNLTDPWPPELCELDVVLLRNVLMYLTDEVRAAILQQLAVRMRPDGYLFLGAAETVRELTTLFTRQRVGDAQAYRPAAS